MLPLLMLGVLLGHVSDREHRAEMERDRRAAAALLHRDAIELNTHAQALVSDLIHRAGISAHTEPRRAPAQWIPDPDD